MTGRALLDSVAADRLAKICGLLGSPHDGERAAAGLKADQLVRQLGMTWADIFAVPSIVSDPPAFDLDYQRMAGYCNANRWRLNARDRAFINGVCAWRGGLTEKQKDWLADIYARLHQGAGR